MGDAPRFDLQSHSRYSDGALFPDGVVATAAAAGVELLALTDHDSVDGITQATVAEREHGLRLVPAVEISVHDPVAADLHVCGYCIDPGNADLVTELAASREDRASRADRTADLLESLGFAVDRSRLAARRAAGGSIGRPHLAQAVVEHPDNAARLEDEGIHDPTQFLVAYLIEDRPAWMPRAAPDVARAAELIHGAGGVAVWAHPFWDVASTDDVLATLERFSEFGIDGAETFYVTHTEAQTRALAGRCGELGMLSTGSSDFHGPHHRNFSRFRAFSTYGLVPELGPIGDL